MSKTNELYQLKVDVGTLNTMKTYWADVTSVSPSSEQKSVAVAAGVCSDEGLTLKTSAQ